MGSRMGALLLAAANEAAQMPLLLPLPTPYHIALSFVLQEWIAGLDIMQQVSPVAAKELRATVHSAVCKYASRIS